MGSVAIFLLSLLGKVTPLAILAPICFHVVMIAGALFMPLMTKKLSARGLTLCYLLSSLISSVVLYATVAAWSIILYAIFQGFAASGAVFAFYTLQKLAIKRHRTPLYAALSSTFLQLGYLGFTFLAFTDTYVRLITHGGVAVLFLLIAQCAFKDSATAISLTETNPASLLVHVQTTSSAQAGNLFLAAQPLLRYGIVFCGTFAFIALCSPLGFVLEVPQFAFLVLVLAIVLKLPLGFYSTRVLLSAGFCFTLFTAGLTYYMDYYVDLTLDFVLYYWTITVVCTLLLTGHALISATSLASASGISLPHCQKLVISLALANVLGGFFFGLLQLNISWRNIPKIAYGVGTSVAGAGLLLTFLLKD
eukprot:m.16150 g.16150  ORF g.16150 m.16150 type:complete len:363 (+) comp10300_c0_seq1:169-1257(+)